MVLLANPSLESVHADQQPWDDESCDFEKKDLELPPEKLHLMPKVLFCFARSLALGTQGQTRLRRMFSGMLIVGHF